MNKFEVAVVNEPSVFEPSIFQCETVSDSIVAL